MVTFFHIKIDNIIKFRNPEIDSAPYVDNLILKIQIHPYIRMSTRLIDGQQITFLDFPNQKPCICASVY